MLTIIVPGGEFFDEKNNVVITKASKELQLEHSLISISKWESKWCIPFLSKEEKSVEQTIDYVKCMTLTQNVDPEVYDRLTDQNLMDVKKYIEAPMTATWFNEAEDSRANSEQVTAELIYYWMISLQIPVEFQKWHLNRLLTLIRVCNIKNTPGKKMSKKDIMSRNAALNAARRQKFNSKG